MNLQQISDSSLSNAEKRKLRLRMAREKGTHTKTEWIEMLSFFENTCCACLGDYGDHIVKDHIIPIYQGGSDSIRNLQPLCYRCNSSKGPDISDWRPQLADMLGKQLPEIYTNPF